MILTDFPVIDLAATGSNIRRLRISHGLTVRDLQDYFGFAEPRAIYKWQKGECLPTVDNLYALGILFGVPMDSILVPAAPTPYIRSEQQANACCSVFFVLYENIQQISLCRAVARSNFGSAADHSRYCAETRVCGGMPTDTPALCNVRKNY